MLVRVPPVGGDPRRPRSEKSRTVSRSFWTGALLGLVCLSVGTGGLRSTARGADSPTEIRLASASLDDLLAAAQSRIAAQDGVGADALLRRALRVDADDTRASDLLRVMYDGGGGFKLPIDRVGADAALSQLGPGAWESETPHFVIVSDADRTWTRQRGALLERAYDEVHRFGTKLGVRMHPPETKLLCVLLADHAEYETLAQTHDSVRATWVSGYYASGSNRVVFYDDSTGPAFADAKSRLQQMRDKVAAQHGSREQTREAQSALAAQDDRINAAASAASTAKTVHEAAHLIAYNCGIQSRARQAPFWFTEGLATNFETPTGQGRFGPESADDAREKEFDHLLIQGAAIPLAQFVGMTEAPEAERDRVETMYAQAYALFRYLSRSERDSLGKFASALLAEPAGTTSPARLRALFEAAFGPIDALERRWMKFEAAR